MIASAGTACTFSTNPRLPCRSPATSPCCTGWPTSSPNGSQFIVATHSPILMGFPEATIYQLDDRGLELVPYEHTEHYQLTRSFLESPERLLRHLFDSFGTGS
jgi:hypothetical protein